MMDIFATNTEGLFGTATSILLIILGILALVFPALVFLLLVLFLTVFAVIVSLGLIRSGIYNSRETRFHRMLLMMLGSLGILLGISVVVVPNFLNIAAKDLFAVWAVVAGAGNLIYVFSRTEGIERVLNALSGIVLIIVGLLLLVVPAIIADYVLVIALGLFAIITGIFSLWFSRVQRPGKKTINHGIYK